MHIETAGSPEASLNRYLVQVRKIEQLTAEQEGELFRCWHELGDRAALQVVVKAHLPLAIKMAFAQRRGGQPLADLVAQANLGLMQAAEKFDPTRGARFATVAAFWIRSALGDMAINNWSFVRLPGGYPFRKALWRLPQERARMDILDDRELTVEEAAEIAGRLDVTPSTVLSADTRLRGDTSLNAPAGEGKAEMGDLLADDAPWPDEVAIANDRAAKLTPALAAAMAALPEREQVIVRERVIADQPVLLETLAVRFGVSRERVRQLEVQALKRLRTAFAGEFAEAA